MRRSVPYALVGLGLVLGLVFVLFRPVPNPTLNSLLGAAFLAAAIASVTYLIVAGSGPDERGPNF